MGRVSYAARVVDAVREGLAVTDDLHAIADRIDMDTDIVRRVVDILR